MSQESPKVIRFPSIETPRIVFPHIERAAQFTGINRRTKVGEYDTTRPLPTLTFRGTVKLHGQNTAIVQTNAGQSTRYQSRERILSDENDPVGFRAHMLAHEASINGIFKYIVRSHVSASGKAKRQVVDKENIHAVAIYGEWCGGNIQKGVAISTLEKMFVIFAVKIVYQPSAPLRIPGDRQEFLDMSRFPKCHNEKARIFTVFQFQIFEVAIDFADPKSVEEGQKKMEELTLGVQGCCPVGKFFGVEGKGEGIVWQAVVSSFDLDRFAGQKCWIKTKDIKQAPGSKPISNLNGPMTLTAGVLNDKFVVNGKPEVNEKSVVNGNSVSNGNSVPNGNSSLDGKPALTTNLTTKHSVDSALRFPPPPTPKSLDLTTLASSLLPAWRLNQGLQHLEREILLPRHIRCLGPYIEWVIHDVFKEEHDRIASVGLNNKDLCLALAGKAMKFYLDSLEEEWWGMMENMWVGA